MGRANTGADGTFDITEQCFDCRVLPFFSCSIFNLFAPRSHLLRSPSSGRIKEMRPLGVRRRDRPDPVEVLTGFRSNDLHFPTELNRICRRAEQELRPDKERRAVNSALGRSAYLND